MTATSFEVGSVFRIVDDFSPQLRKLLAELREINKVLNTVRENLAKIGIAPGVDAAIKEAGDLARVWGEVATNADLAQVAIRRAGTASARSTGAAVAGGGGRHRPGWLSGGLGGGGRHTGGLGLAAGGLFADAIYQASELQKEAFLSWWHSGLSDNPESRKRIRDLLQDSSAVSGFSFKDVGEASEDIFRLMKGTPNNGLDAAPELLRAGATEALIKGTGLKESVKSIVEMAHMQGVYDPEQLKALAPIIGFLSTLNPASLPQFGRSASYSVPTLTNALGMNAADVLFANTAIARAGATGSKSGTWVEHTFDRALPPDPHSMPGPAYGRRMWAMRQAGLIGADGKSTILGPDGKIDIEKFLNTTRAALDKLSIAERNSVERSVFGEQGARGYELMTSPAVMEQTRKLKAEMPDFAPKYNAFLGLYNERSTIQKARTTYAEFNNLLSDIGDKVLPGVNHALSDFRAVLEAIRGALPGGGPKGGAATIGARVFEGAIAGGALGAVFGPGIFPGAIAGGVAGGVEGIAEQWMASHPSALSSDRQIFPGGTQGAAPVELKANANVTINLDGRRLSNAVVPFLVGPGHSTSAPVSNAARTYRSGDD